MIEVPVLLFLLACAGAPPAAPEATGPALLGPSDVVTVSSGLVATGPRVSGTLEAAERAVIRAEASGSVEAVSAEIGQAVRAGEVLARIEASAATTALASARAGVVSAEQDVAMAERDLERAKALVAAGALASRDAEMAESQLVGARARLKDAEARSAAAAKQASGTVVRAPIAGVVSERSVSQGDVVAPGSPLFTVIDRSSLRLQGSVPADAVQVVTVGRSVQVTVQGHPGKVYTGSVERVAPAVDAVTRQLPVLVALPNAEGELVAGLFAEGRVATEAREGIVVPADAVGADGTVVRVQAGKVEQVAVQVGLRDEDAERVEVTGLSAGDVLLVGAARSLAPGTAVTLPASTAQATGG